jgi:hypothetical protein
MAAKVDELQKQIAQLDGQLQTIEQSENASQKELAGLETKRRNLVTEARLNKSQKAKTALEALDSDIFKARRAVEDDATVKADLLRQLEAAKNNLSVAEWEEQRKSVRAKVEICANSDKPQRVKEHVMQLLELLKEIDEEEREATKAIQQFEPRRLAGCTLYTANWRFERICADLNYGGWEFYRWHGRPDIGQGYSSPSPGRLLGYIDELEA